MALAVDQEVLAIETALDAIRKAVMIARGRYGLTFAEAQVLRRVVMGCSPDDVAVERAVAVTTVYAQAKKIRKKMECTSIQSCAIHVLHIALRQPRGRRPM